MAMRQQVAWAFALVGAIGVTGCGDDDEGDAQPTEWLGAGLHLVTYGDAGADDIGSDPAFDLDAGEAADVTECGRQYRVTDPSDPSTWDDGNGVLSELEVTIEVEVGDEEREYQIGFESGDFTRFAPGTTITVVADPDDGSAPPLDLAWAEFQGEWEDAASNQIEFELKAKSGSFTLEELSGGAGGALVIPDDTGNLGGFFSLVFTDDTELTGSFTVACGENDVEAFGD